MEQVQPQTIMILALKEVMVMQVDKVYNKSSQLMPELIDNSIDCVMTSPPY